MTGDAGRACRLAGELVIEYRLAACKDARRHLTQGHVQRREQLCDGPAEVRLYGAAVDFGELFIDAHKPQLPVEKRKTHHNP